MMIRGLFTGRTGMRAQELQLDAISNNLANVNTTGFKKSRAQFEDLFYQEARAVGTENVDGIQIPSGIQIGIGVRAQAIQKIFTQGSLTESGNELDWSISGKGFFQIIRDGEEFYTRAGNFTLDADGFIVTQNGDRLQPEFSVPEEGVTISIDSSGFLSVKDANQDIIASTQITTHDFINPGGLRALGSNLFAETEASGTPREANPGSDGLGIINQGFLEVSNVDVTEELVNLIITQRAFESNSQVVDTADQMLEIANTIGR